MKLALITLSGEGVCLARAISACLGECDMYVHRDVRDSEDATQFDRTIALTDQIFNQYEGLVYIMPTGVVVRALDGKMNHKTQDPAVVAVDVGGRWAISLLSGHEGHANELAISVANVLDAEPIISTTTEAVKTLLVGVGCRRGVPADTILHAISQCLDSAGKSPADIRLIASVDIKQNEPGLLEAARQLDVPIRFLSSESIRQCKREFEHSSFVQQKVNLPGVAEPAALLAGRRTELLLSKQKFQGVTVALATERCMWSE